MFYPGLEVVVCFLAGSLASVSLSQLDVYDKEPV